MDYYKTHKSRVTSLLSNWSRYSRISLSYVTEPAGDWYKSNNPIPGIPPSPSDFMESANFILIGPPK